MSILLASTDFWEDMEVWSNGLKIAMPEMDIKVYPDEGDVDKVEYAVVWKHPPGILRQYPNLKASIDITYRPVTNNLKELLLEAEKLVFKHAVKAEQIVPKDFVNAKKRVFGSLYEITGNAASHLQFHVTDSTHNFIKGSLYFYAKPNYD